MTYNWVKLRGYVGSNPFIKYTSPTTCIARFSIATHRDGYIDDEGNHIFEEVTEWHSIICFNELAQVVEMKVGTGCLLELEGRITYEDRRLASGERIKSSRIEATKIDVIEQRKEENLETEHKEEIKTNPYGKYLDTLSHDSNSGELPF